VTWIGGRGGPTNIPTRGRNRPHINRTGITDPSTHGGIYLGQRVSEQSLIKAGGRVVRTGVAPPTPHNGAGFGSQPISPAQLEPPDCNPIANRLQPISPPSRFPVTRQVAHGFTGVGIGTPLTVHRVSSALALHPPHRRTYPQPSPLHGTHTLLSRAGGDTRPC
jgi:hypothetical protein